MCRNPLAVGDALIELRIWRSSFRALLNQVSVLALPLQSVEHLLRATRWAGEPHITSDDLEDYCKNSLRASYDRDKEQRGVSVLKAGNSGRQTKPEYFLHIHRLLNGGIETELAPGFLGRYLKLRHAVFRYCTDETYDAQSLAADLFATPTSGRSIEDSMAHSMLGLSELVQERPLAGDTERLLAKIATLDRIHPSILKCPHDRNSACPSTAGTGGGTGVGAGTGVGGGTGSGVGAGVGGGTGSGVGGGAGGGAGVGGGMGGGGAGMGGGTGVGGVAGDGGGGGMGCGKGRGKGGGREKDRRKGSRPNSGDSGSGEGGGNGSRKVSRTSSPSGEK